MKKSRKTFIFKYDPNCGPDRMFADFKLAAEGKLRSVESNIIRSNNLEVLLNSINNNRWDIFVTLNQKKPESLMELAKLLSRDYGNVGRDARTLEAMGIIKLKKIGKEIKPLALYDDIIGETQSQSLSTSELWRKEGKQQILIKPREVTARIYSYDQK